MAIARVETNRAGAVWEITAKAELQGEDLHGPAEVDVAIVGAGFTGLRAALDLAEAGCSVAVFEAGELAWGASGRSGGQVNPMLPVARPGELLKAIGPVYFERLVEASLRSADDLFDLIRKYGIDCDARQKGWLRVDHCAKARGIARAAAQEWNRHGAGFEFVDHDDVLRMTGSPAYSSGVLAPRGGAVQPLSLAFGMARAARAAGARLYRFAPVTSAERKDQKWHLAAGGHPVVCQQLILATNGYSGRLNKPVMQSVLPLVPVQIATEPLSDEVIGSILSGGQTISDTRRMIMYARREPDNRMVFGGIGYRQPLGGTGGFNWLLRDVKRVFPALRNAAWPYRWSGRIAITSDHIPHFHEPEPGMLAGLGYNGRGVAMANLMGKWLASRALGADPHQLPIPCSKAEPLAWRTPQVLGAGIAMPLMRLRDRMEWRTVPNS
jgi:glycine/D-amino acid oxidase-like deaminating enzyme